MLLLLFRLSFTQPSCTEDQAILLRSRMDASANPFPEPLG